MAVAPRFSPEVQEAFVRFARMGISIRDAAREIGISEKTVKRWLLNGTREPDGPYGEFTRRVNVAREQADGDGLSEEMTPEELLRVASRAARKGSVQAMRLVWDMLGKRRAEPGSEDDGEEGSRDEDQMKALDELAERRTSRQ